MPTLLQSILDETVRDITKVGVCPAPKSEVREILLKALSRLGREVVGAVPNIQDELPRDERREKTEEVTGISRQSFDCCGEGEMNGWNSAREAVIKALKDNGVDV